MPNRKAFCISAIFLLLATSSVVGDTEKDRITQDSKLDGTWISGEVTAPSQHSSRGYERATDLLEKEIVIAGNTLELPSDQTCTLSDAEPQVLRNDMRTFGSFGGDWSRIGLYGTNHNFSILSFALNCEDTVDYIFRIIAQPENQLYLLDFGRVFSVLHRIEP